MGGTGSHNGTHKESRENIPGGLPNPFDILDDYNYSYQTDEIPYYQLHNLTHDIDIMGQYGVTYSNGSNTSISLHPFSIRQTVSQLSGGLSSNFTMNSNAKFSAGYGQSLTSGAFRSVTGMNLDPVTGKLTSRINISSGPYTVQSSLSISATIRPLEIAMKAATEAGLAGIVAAGLYLSSPTPEKVIFPTYLIYELAK
jgi:hypothetical protein